RCRRYEPLASHRYCKILFDHHRCAGRWFFQLAIQQRNTAWASFPGIQHPGHGAKPASICHAKTRHQPCKGGDGYIHGWYTNLSWAVSYPGFMDDVVTIVGSPKPTSYDLMLYTTYRTIIDSDAGFEHGNYTTNPNIPLANMLWELFLTTPTNRVNDTPASGFADWLKFA